jgi:hypothetical protein
MSSEPILTEAIASHPLAHVSDAIVRIKIKTAVTLFVSYHLL